MPNGNAYPSMLIPRPESDEDITLYHGTGAYFEGKPEGGYADAIRTGMMSATANPRTADFYSSHTYDSRIYSTSMPKDRILDLTDRGIIINPHFIREEIDKYPGQYDAVAIKAFPDTSPYDDDVEYRLINSPDDWQVAPSAWKIDKYGEIDSIIDKVKSGEQVSKADRRKATGFIIEQLQYNKDAVKFLESLDDSSNELELNAARAESKHYNQLLNSLTDKPETEKRLFWINKTADYDEEISGLISHPTKDTSDQFARHLLGILDEHADMPNPESAGTTVYSFDIDLTLEMPEDEPGSRGAVPIRHLNELQDQGYIVGTTSDREPSDQQKSMESLGFTPDFTIPKELLEVTGRMFPGAKLVHVGDDAQRDRAIAERAGWEHAWPHEYFRQTSPESALEQEIDSYKNALRVERGQDRPRSFEYQSTPKPAYQARRGRGNPRR